MNLKLVKIPKKTKGQFREICIPSAEQKKLLREVVPELNEKSKVLCDKDVVHGFMHMHSPVTNAKKHIGYNYTLKFDLSDFFDTVKPEHLRGKIPVEMIEKTMPNNRAYQGLPTSPIIANIAATDMDRAITKKIKDLPIVYTRYADDLCFSFNEHEHCEMLKKVIPQIVGRCGFKLNVKKTWLQDSRFGNRIITGVVVTNEGIKATRATKRKLRAANHQKNKNVIRGLNEWIKLKEPQEKDLIKPRDFTELLRVWGLANIPFETFPKKKTTKLSSDVIISGDVVQILGLSNFTSNWTSCMEHPRGMYHRGAMFWALNDSTRIAGYLAPKKTLTVSGITRPCFKARTLIHTDQNGNQYYDRIYGESTDAANNLKKVLEDANIKWVRNAEPRIRMKGLVSVELFREMPYLDSLSYGKNDNNEYYTYRS